MTLIAWQEKLMKEPQAPGETLHESAVAKLRTIERCPVKVSDAQKIGYLMQRLLKQHILTAIPANRTSPIAYLTPPEPASTIARNISMPKQARHKLVVCKAAGATILCL
ncbi:hypothetical protein HPB48_010368 [Haemaphysalis longicornis]|uniref:Uncharacterized protein n=1 Tax=Haemaphysalis longicornis TaxID=44386 RepID=A0A9J6GA59_HAELO|nr:hypothetical protein HPB48_010368 [Haemaphysalis longicornis]